VDRQWHSQMSKKKTSGGRQKEEGKGSGLAVLANYLGLRAEEGFLINDDEFDAILCALTGCLPDCTIQEETLAARIRQKVLEYHGEADWINDIKPPRGYVLFDRLADGIQVHVKRLYCLEPENLLACLQP